MRYLTTKRALLMLTALCGMCLAGGQVPTARADSGNIEVGVIGPMTGANAPYGSLAWRGASLAVVSDQLAIEPPSLVANERSDVVVGDFDVYRHNVHP